VIEMRELHTISKLPRLRAFVEVLLRIAPPVVLTCHQVHDQQTMRDLPLSDGACGVYEGRLQLLCVCRSLPLADALDQRW
jgi:hypothetical protein